MIEWRFPSNDFGEIKGINDSAISMFKGAPLKSLAREICQNSLDAANAKTVVIEFDMFSIPSSEMPGKEYLKDVFSRCKKFWATLKDPATRDFFNNAIEKISEDNVTFLRISDFNTKGLTGSREEINTNWTNLTKSSGASDKKGAAGGSFGIGKFAPFACSDFYTVFYSTYDENEERAYQGVSRLVTFTRDDGNNTQGVGYFGEERNIPVYDEIHLDNSFNRQHGEHGTDIYIAGYKFNGDNWKKDILVSILDGFLGAIWNEKLEVNIGGIQVNKNNLGQIIDEYRDDIKKNYTDKYYDVLVSNESKWFVEEDYYGMGEVKLGLLLGDSEASNRVSMIRQTGMKIKDKARLGGHIPITGIMFINGDKINRRLRRIENPEHDKWEPDRDKNPMQAKQLIRSLNDYIRGKIEELISSGTDESVDAAGVGSFLPDEVEDSEDQSREEVLSEKVIDVEVREMNKISLPQNSNGENEAGDKDGHWDKGGTGETWFHNGGHTNKPQSKPGQPAHKKTGGNDTMDARTNVGLERFTFMAVNKEQGEYLLKFSPNKTGTDGKMKLYLSAETDKYEAPIKKAELLEGGEITVQGNVIGGLEYVKGQDIRLKIELDYYDYCAMEVVLDAASE